MEIVKYESISKRRVATAVTIDDRDFVGRLIERIGQIPPDGPKMISFGPDAEHVDLRFHCGDGAVQTVGVYERRFKTPSTGFNSGPDAIESALYADIEALLFPDVDKKTPLVAGLALRFQDFTVTYRGRRRAEAPVTTAPVTHRFTVEDRSGQAQTLRVVAGQMPPPPTSFAVGGKQWTLLTYETRDRQRLYPDHFQIVRAKH